MNVRSEHLHGMACVAKREPPLEWNKNIVSFNIQQAYQF